MRFEAPLALLLLLLIPLLLLLRRRWVRGASVRFSSTDHARRAGPSLRQKLRGLPGTLRALTLACLAVALARPQEGRERVRDHSKGIAIEMVVDRSGSMGAEMALGDERLTRLEAVKRVFLDFVRGDGEALKGRPNDLIGMVAFARYPDTVCPLTLGHGALARFLENVKLVRRRSEDGTAIGDALALAAARLHTAEETLRQRDPDRAEEYEIKSKIIILLTDGANNAGERDPLAAAKLAAAWGIKIYAIGIGGGENIVTINDPFFGPRKVRMGRGEMDEDTLKALADATGGLYRSANDAEALRAVYAEIDRLERSEIESLRFLDYRERFAPLALAALALLGLETLLRCTWLRTIP